jgi:predicted nucleic acid-binding protein
VPTLTYVDTSVLIAVARGDDATHGRALAVLDDADRVFASSVFVELEAVPKAAFHGRSAEVAIYEAFFAAVTEWARDVEDVVRRARAEARLHGLSALDALHIGAASSVGAAELLTAERPEKPIFRTKSVKVVTIRS